MSAPPARKGPGPVELRIARILRAGVALSSVLMLAGLVLTFVHNPAYLDRPEALADALAPATARHNPAEVLEGLRHGSGKALISLGLMVLLATPVVRVLLSIFVFLREGDRVFVGITALVLVLLVLSLGSGLVSHG